MAVTVCSLGQSEKFSILTVKPPKPIRFSATEEIAVSDALFVFGAHCHRWVSLKHGVDRKEQSLRASFPCRSYDLFQRVRILQSERSRLCPAQCCHTASAAQCLTDIMAECSNVCSLGAVDIQNPVLSFSSNKLKTVNRDLSRSSFHCLPPSGQLVKPFSVHLDGGVHGRSLHDLPLEAQKCLFQFGLCYFWKRRSACSSSDCVTSTSRCCNTVPVMSCVSVSSPSLSAAR